MGSSGINANLWKPSLFKTVAQIPRQGNTSALKGTFGQKTLECCSNQQCRCISVNTALGSSEQETHTGQVWDEDDARQARFMGGFGVAGREKQTNKRWAIDLIAEEPVIMVKTRIVACTGGDNPALGHPKVYINLDNHEPACCIYCGLRYQLEEGH